MPKRSSGCDLCRKRKVRCDEARPRCQRCTNFGAICPGYTRTESVVFRDQTTTTASKAKERRLIRRHSSSTDDQSQIHLLMSPPESLTSDSLDQSLASTRSASPHSINSIPETRAMLLAKFLETYFPHDNSLTTIQNPYAYLAELPHANSDNLAFASALDALTLVQIGTYHGDQSLLHESRLVYGKALSYLYRALLHPKLQAQDDTLGAVSILGLCDFFRGTSQNGTGWLSHATGAKGLLRHRGPQSIKSPLAMKLFLSQRMTFIFSGLLSRKGVFFDNPDWLELTAQSAEHNDWIALTNIMVELPQLLEDSDIVTSPSRNLQVGEVPHDVFSVLGRFTQLHKRLLTWYSDLRQNSKGDFYEEVDVKEMTEFWKICPDASFPTVINYANFSLGYLCSLYSLSSYLICKNAADVHSNIPKHILTPIMAGPRGQQSLEVLRNLAHNHIMTLSRSVPYLITSPGASVGRIQSLAFLWFAQDYFGSRAIAAQAGTIQMPKPSLRPQEFSRLQHWCWKIFTILAERGIVPPRVTLPVNSNEAGKLKCVAKADQTDNVEDAIFSIVSQIDSDVKNMGVDEEGYGYAPIDVTGFIEKTESIEPLEDEDSTFGEIHASHEFLRAASMSSSDQSRWQDPTD